MGNQIVERLRIELPRYVILMYQIPDILSMNHLVYITKFVLSCKTITFHLWNFNQLFTDLLFYLSVS